MWLWSSGRALGTWQCDFSSGALAWQRSRSTLDLLLSSRNESHIGTSPPHLCTAKITALTPELPSSHSPYTARLELVLGDVLKCEALPHFDVCVANLPYQGCALIFGFSLLYVDYVLTTSTIHVQYIYCTYELNAVLFIRIWLYSYLIIIDRSLVPSSLNFFSTSISGKFRTLFNLFCWTNLSIVKYECGGWVGRIFGFSKIGKKVRELPSAKGYLFLYPCV